MHACVFSLQSSTRTHARACECVYTYDSTHTKTLSALKKNVTQLSGLLQKRCTYTKYVKEYVHVYNLMVTGFFKAVQGNIMCSIVLNEDVSVNTMLFAGDQVILQETGDELQQAAFQLH